MVGKTDWIRDVWDSVVILRRIVTWSRIRREEDDATFGFVIRLSGMQHARRLYVEEREEGGGKSRVGSRIGSLLVLESAEYRSASWKHRFLLNFFRAAIFPVAWNSFEPDSSKSLEAARKCSRENSRKERRKSARSLLHSNWKLVVSMAERRERTSLGAI